MALENVIKILNVVQPMQLVLDKALAYALHSLFLSYSLRQNVLSRCVPSQAIEHTMWHAKLLFDDQNSSPVPCI